MFLLCTQLLKIALHFLLLLLEPANSLNQQLNPSGIQNAVQHDLIMNSSQNDYIIVNDEAEKVILCNKCSILQYLFEIDSTFTFIHKM